MRSVLISTKPQWCELIANGKKNVEVRKTKPKLETPFKVYIYQTRKPVEVAFSGTGRHISEYDKTCYYTERSGKVIGEFVCDRIIDIPYSQYFVDYYHTMPQNDLEATCLDMGHIDEYLLSKNGYGWHISDLVIYDKPKELSEFARPCPDNVRSCAMCRRRDYTGMHCNLHIKPPQSWCYVERSRP